MNTKKFIYDKLKLGLNDVDIHFQSDNENENNFSTKFPLITYYRLNGKKYKTGQDDSLFQITAWGENGLEAESLKDRIVEILEAYDTNIVKQSITINQDIYDSNAFGVPITYSFTVRN